MNTILDSVLDQFNQEDVEQEKPVNTDKKRKEYVMQNNSIIERVDKIFLTEDGRQLLREQY